jgi:hypothetical protein
VFRRRHLKALADLFVQVLKLAEKAGLVKLGHFALTAPRSNDRWRALRRCRSRTPHLRASRLSPLSAACNSLASVGKVMALGWTVVSSVTRLARVRQCEQSSN